MKNLVPVAAFCFVVLFSAELVSSRWCTRLKSETSVKTFVESAMCNESYEVDCGWFASTKCVQYDSVPCLVKKNRTIIRYKIIEECCKGYELDPINNITCIWIHGEMARISGSEGRIHYYEDDDSLLWGLSHGAYAGIICSFVFIICVAILIGLHMRKRHLRARAKVEEPQKMQEMSEKLMPAADA
ncbi:uncharacterized protein LOC101847799 [Aplysia californica]|uniref:Uncharacterized protein LOC101847799 n=1 Tax=Aplysia californica TaxID=6500 RepID=A0ABM0ZU82_APLCA|nr:uncharacterized protein LOC101847799 [Aplysia californica]